MVVMVATVARRDIIGLRGKLPGGCVAWRLLALLVTPIKEISEGQEEELSCSRKFGGKLCKNDSETRWLAEKLCLLRDLPCAFKN